jgi:ribosomal protein S18 acetylase RimI-like enzyme
MNDLTIQLEPDAVPADHEAVLAGLRAHNRRHAPDPGWLPLAILLRDTTGVIRGGLLGETGWEWLHIEFLWVDDALQRRGFGRAMLAQAEAEAVRRGCRGVYLDTHDFQAPAFYLEHGYEVFGVLDDYPRGFRRHFLRKSLAVSIDSRPSMRQEFHMPEPAAPAATAFQAYVASLFKALGARDPFEVLAQTPAALRQAASGLTPEQEVRPEAPGKWSVRQVVQHLADSELVGGFRFRMILAHDTPALPGYDQDLWVERLAYQESDVPTALQEFAVLRQSNLRLLRRATPADLDRVMRHSERGDEPLGQMIPMYAGHDLVHLRQIARIRRAVGAASIPSL